MIPTTPSGHSTASHTTSKRRKIRKGTFSCWECKRRKQRCERASPNDQTCVSCKRHNLSCVSQDCDEDPSSHAVATEGRIRHVEDLVAQLISQRTERARDVDGAREGSVAAELRGRATSAKRRMSLSSAALQAIRHRAPSLRLAISEDLLSRCRSMSTYLDSNLPDVATTAKILGHGKGAFDLFEQMNAHQPPSNARLEPTKTHPIVYARKLLRLAIALRYLEAGDSRPVALDEPAGVLAKRYADISNHVTAQDVLVNSVEGLETLLLEAMYFVHVGDMESAWLTFRRALSLAQVVGLDKSNARLESVCFHLMSADRQMSLILSRPCIAVPDDFEANIGAPEDAHSPLGRMKRAHVAVMGRIIARNVRIQRKQQFSLQEIEQHDEIEETRHIDLMLTQVAAELPLRWWSRPEVTLVTDYSQKAEVSADYERLIAQASHAHLILLLHQPLAIRATQQFFPIEPTSAVKDLTYSVMAIASSGRDLLALFLMLCKYVHVPAARVPSIHKVYLAATILLLAHIDGHCSEQVDLLGHSRPHDLKLVTDVVVSIEDICASLDGNHIHEVRLIKRLVDIEANAARGIGCDIRHAQYPRQDTACDAGDSETILQLPVPYFGIIQVIPRGCEDDTHVSN